MGTVSGGRVKRPSKTDLCWAAGLFEGEGYVCSLPQRARDGSMSTRIYATMGLEMTDDEIVQKFHSIIGLGSVGARGRKSRVNGLWVASSTWAAGSRDAVTTICGWLYPYLGTRRQEKIVDCLATDTRLA